MENIVIPARKREITGTKGARSIRREGMIPGIVYGGVDPVPVSVSLNELRHVVYTPDFHRIELTLNGEKIPCIVKEVQFHPVTEAVTHVDFLRLTEGQKIKVEVPLRFEGISIGLKAGGKLIQKLRRIKIKTTPENLVSEVSVDVTDLNLRQSVRVRDIQAGEGIEILNSPGIPVATVDVPRALKSATSSEKKAEEGEASEEDTGVTPAETPAEDQS